MECPLPTLGSLRLLVPPLRLVAAYVWQVTRRGDVMQYGILADFVSLVMEAVPELLSPKHAVELILGLRARVVLELCRGDHAVASDELKLHLDSIQLLLPTLRAEDGSLGDSETGFMKLVQTLLEDSEERKSFFQDVFPDVCGSRYDEVLQVLMWDFLRRLEKLLPVPDLLQVVSWLDGSAALAAECTECIAHPENLKALTQCTEVLARLDPPNEAAQTWSRPQCPFSHQQEELVRPHQELVHTDQTQTAPPSGTALTAHQHTHSGERPFTCQQCDKSFAHSQALARHRYTHGAPRLYECGRCPEVFPSIAVRNEHRRAQHEPKNYCAECDKRFSSPSALQRHLLLHQQERPYKCSKCPATFPCLPSLTRHGVVHRTERSYPCSCGKSFTYRGALLSHQCVRSNEWPFLCDDCGKSFPYKVELENHRLIHSDNRPFLCPHCGKAFKRQRGLNKHVNGHTREKVFHCSQCDKTFCFKASLTRHELTHSGERPFLCDDCGKGFFSQGELQKHQRFHTGHKPFRCAVCDKSFTQSCYLTLHMRYHTGARPYTCTSCGKSFYSSYRLKRHMRTHTGEKPYRCTVCLAHFQQSYQLKAHRKTHHTLNPDQ
ncbi:gastrula zinc finger protein XlCGF26.1-like isoform X2 [Alosa sapidissima]|uniref:gastrula zinc finger protein XlCGF26.1-like isoform X2 n=1 Tax=Alosa sapidissima TaxID=34773 RepID=UPI001C08B2A0|nr:gastrula zinc finger protein XlCGF26.1-like isoform X2 [Alosa sapidissima]